MKPGLLSVLLALTMPPALLAGTNGILEGNVKDAKTGEPLTGVNVVIVELQQGTTSDSEGRYQIQNVRAGSYQIRFFIIGYTPHLIKNVIINPDLRTRLNIGLEVASIDLDEVVVVQEKPLIQKDVTGTTFIVGSEEIEVLPIDAVTDALRLKPGVTLEGNVRGGKSTEVLYLVDGLPIQDVLEGGLAGTLPNSSVFGASFYVGGLDAEYGNALSGVVNIVTKTGASTHKLVARADKDNLFGGTQNSRTTEFELAGNGPLVENRLYYIGAFNGQLSDTRWWQDFDMFFKSPIDKRFSGFGKLDYLFSPTLRLGLQGLLNVHDWRDYEFNWRYNLGGLPTQKRSAYRFAAILSHSIS
ncbi:MAG TPA: carboxypeptidase-like regulatory domain-containing protein, partial [Bacteroidota bacterium]